MSDRMIFETLPLADGPLRTAIRRLYLADEGPAVESLLDEAAFDVAARNRVDGRARELASAVRAGQAKNGMEGFLQEYSLATEEGVVLMCLAEALLRIPDSATADRLIHDKLSAAHWEK